MNVMDEPPRRIPAYSETRAAAVGMRPPRPRPARNRKSPKTSGDGATARRDVKKEKLATLKITAFRRPTTSLTAPMESAPIIIPTSPYEAMTPTPEAVSPHGS